MSRMGLKKLAPNAQQSRSVVCNCNFAQRSCNDGMDQNRLDTGLDTTNGTFEAMQACKTYMSTWKS